MGNVTAGDKVNPPNIGAMAPWDLWLSRFSRVLPGTQPDDVAAIAENRATPEQHKRVELAMAHAAIRLRDAEVSQPAFGEPSVGKPS